MPSGTCLACSKCPPGMTTCRNDIDLNPAFDSFRSVRSIMARDSSRSRRRDKERKRKKHEESDSDSDEDRRRRRKDSSRSRKSSKDELSSDLENASSCSSSTDSSSNEDDGRHRKKHKDERKKKKRKHKKHDRESRHSKKTKNSTKESEDGEMDGKRDKKKQKHRKRQERKKESSSGADSDDGTMNETASPETVATDIITKFPKLAGELKQLLHMLDSGQGVDVSGIQDEDIRALLHKLFRSLRLSEVQDQVYLLPEGSQPTLVTLSAVLKNVPEQEMDGSTGKVDSEEKDSYLGIGPDERPAAAPSQGPRARVIGPAMPTPEMLAAAARLTEAEEALRKAEEELAQDPFIGPPPPGMIAEAESANEAERFEEVSRILDPDLSNAYEILGLKADATAESIKKKYWKLSLLVHPDKCSHPQAQEAFTTINKAFQDLQDPTKRAGIDYIIAEKQRKKEEEAELKSLREAAQWRRMRGEIALVGDDELLGTGPKAPNRDEWMTKLPPERQAGPPSMHSTFFSKSEKSGRGDTSIWTDTPLDKAEKAKIQYLEAYKQAALPAAAAEDATESQRASELAKLVDSYNEKTRSESLFAKHNRDASEKKKKKKKSKKNEPVATTHDEWAGNHPWKPWDREKDLSAGRQAVKLDAKSMGQGLESRFSSSGSQRKFL